jgi:N-acetylmuramoyl-L-alanine amidase
VVPLCAAFGASLAADLAELHHVTAVRFWSLSGVTRIAIEADGDFQVKSDRLTDPDRLFFDLMGTRPDLGHKPMTVIPVSDRLVRQIRVAEPQHNVTRVVLDLETAVESTISRLSNPTRLIVEVRASGSAAPTTPTSGGVTAPGGVPAVGGGLVPGGVPAAGGVPAPGGTPAITQAPVKAPPALIEPSPVPKPTQRRPFTPPPAKPPAVIPVVQPQEAWLEPPPELLFRASPAPLPTLFVSMFKPSLIPARAIPASVLAKPVPVSTAPPTASAISATPPAPGETALPAKRNSSGDRSMIRVLGLKVGRIVLDPGHGGHDNGSIGPEGLREKDLVLDVAQRLGRLIETRMGSEVIFTRSDDTFVALERRTEIANDAKADLFLSIHANSSPLRSAAGVETYYLNFTTSRGALDVASRENSGSQMTVYELQGLLEKIALKDKVEESREFATRVQTALFSLSARTDAHSKDRGVKKAPFIVLIGASMPSVLAEIGFVSNAHDESVMRRDEYRTRIAEALYKGISSYAGSLSHFQVAQRH